MSARKDIMGKDTFDAIIGPLHSDCRLSPSDRKLADAFDAFMSWRSSCSTEMSRRPSGACQKPIFHRA
jgi:hypothetical protein